MFLMVYPHMIPTKASPDVGPASSPYGTGSLPGSTTATAGGGNGGSVANREGRNAAVGNASISTAAAAAKADRYIPKVFGFKVNEIAKLQRWQGAVRDRSVFSLACLPGMKIMLLTSLLPFRQIARLEALERGDS